MYGLVAIPGSAAFSVKFQTLSSHRVMIMLLFGSVGASALLQPPNGPARRDMDRKEMEKTENRSFTHEAAGQELKRQLGNN